MELWRPEPDGSAVIATKLEPVRLITGAILALVGIAIGSQVLSAVMASRAATGAAWTEYVPAILIFGGIAMAFVIGGAFMLLYKRFVRVDLVTREVSEHQRYLGYRRTRVYPLSTFTTIVFAAASFDAGSKRAAAAREKAAPTPSLSSS